jgi:hypothetical protein
MEVDQIKGGKSKGGKGQKGPCKICGKTHQGECWFGGKESAKAKGKGKGHAGKGKGKDSEPAKEKCQIYGKQNHTADKCHQRFKDKDQKGPRVQAASTGPGTGTASSGTGGSVAALSRKEADTSPETELRATTTGVCSVTAKGHGLALLDRGSDDHMMVNLKVLVRSFNCESRACYVGNPRESFFRARESKILFRESFAKVGYYNHYM